MVKAYGFNGTTLISYINDQMKDLECFILTAVDTEQIDDGLVAIRNRFSKTIFDTEADDPQKLKELDSFIAMLKEYNGRYYGGGVSELTPSEFKNITVPYREIAKIDIQNLNDKLKRKEPLEEIIRFVNEKTIGNEMAIEEVEKFENIRTKLVMRRN